LKDELQKLKKRPLNEHIIKHRSYNTLDCIISSRKFTNKTFSISVQTDPLPTDLPEKDPNIAMYLRSLQRLCKTQEEFLEQCNEALNVTKFENMKLHTLIGDLEHEKMLLKEKTFNYPEAPSLKKRPSDSEVQGETFDFGLDYEMRAMSAGECLFEWPKDDIVTPIQTKIFTATSPLQNKVSELQEDLKNIKQALVNNENLIKQMIDKKGLAIESKTENMLTTSSQKNLSFLNSSKSFTNKSRKVKVPRRGIIEKAYFTNFIGFMCD